jgi:hypothetical protein
MAWLGHIFHEIRWSIDSENHHYRPPTSPSSRAVLARVKAVAKVVVAEVEGEPLEPSCVDEGEGRSSHRRSGG